VAVTKDGRIYSCGNNDYGQLGHDKTRKRLRKRHIPLNVIWIVSTQIMRFINFTDFISRIGSWPGCIYIQKNSMWFLSYSGSKRMGRSF